MIFVYIVLMIFGLFILQLGFGCVSLVGIFLLVVDVDVCGIIVVVLDVGVIYIDIVLFYGYGLFEWLVGDGVWGCSDVVVLFKVGCLLQLGVVVDLGVWVLVLLFILVFDYFYDVIMCSYEVSLYCFGLDCVDILYIYDIGNFIYGVDDGLVLFEMVMMEGYWVFVELWVFGVILVFGFGVNEVVVCEVVMDCGDWDVLFLVGCYILLEQDLFDGLLVMCVVWGIDIVIGGLFNFGVLVGGDYFDYGVILVVIVEKVRVMKWVCDVYGVLLFVVVLKFLLVYFVVKSIIFGLRMLVEFV